MFKKILISLILVLILYFPAFATDYTGFYESSGSGVALWVGLAPNGLTYSSLEILVTGVTSYPKIFNTGAVRSLTDEPNLSSLYTYPVTPLSASATDLTSGSAVAGDSTYWNNLNPDHLYAFKVYRQSTTLGSGNSWYWYYGINPGRTPYATYGYPKFAVNENGSGFSFVPSGTYISNTFSPIVACINDSCTYEFDPGFPEPSGSVSSQTISIMDNTYVINMEGDFEETGENYVAQITFQPACTTDDGHISLNDDSVVVMFEANNPRTSTEKITDSLYYGEDYSTTSSLYSLHGVKLPFVPGQNCTYIATVSITDYTDPFNPIQIQLDDEADPYTTIMGEFTPTGNTPSMPLIDYEPNTAFCDTFDLSCYVSYGLTQVKNFFLDLYKKIFLNDYNIFDDAVPTVYDGLVATLQTKKPFAYMYNVFDLNLHSSLLSDGIPDMNFTFGNNYGLDDVTVNFPSSFDIVLNSIRSIILIILGTVEVFYFVNLARRVRG